MWVLGPACPAGGSGVGWVQQLGHGGALATAWQDAARPLRRQAAVHLMLSQWLHDT